MCTGGTSRLGALPGSGASFERAASASASDGAYCSVLNVVFVLPPSAVPQLGSCTSSGRVSAGPVQLGTPRAGPSYCGTPATASGARASPIRIVVLLNVVTLPLPRSLRTASVLRVIMQVPSHAMATVTLPLQVPSHAMATCLRTGEAQRDTMVKVLVLSSLQ